MIRTVHEEELRKNNNINSNVKMEEESGQVNTLPAGIEVKIDNSGDNKMNNPFKKGVKDDGSKQKSLFEDLTKSTQSQSKGSDLFSQKIGFKKKQNPSQEEKSKIESQLQQSKVKKV